MAFSSDKQTSILAITTLGTSELYSITEKILQYVSFQEINTIKISSWKLINATQIPGGKIFQPQDTQTTHSFWSGECRQDLAGGMCVGVNLPIVFCQKTELAYYNLIHKWINCTGISLFLSQDATHSPSPQLHTWRHSHWTKRGTKTQLCRSWPKIWKIQSPNKKANMKTTSNKFCFPITLLLRFSHYLAHKWLGL